MSKSSAIFSSWRPAIVNPTLAPGTVALWRFRATGPAGEIFLSAEERKRAQRLRSAEKSRAFVVARTRLRQILSRYLAIDPRAIAFHFNDYGKPFLADDPLTFNLSHSADWGLCAVTQGEDVGVDLEAVNPGLDYAAMATRFFSAAEHAWLQSLPVSRRCRSFYRLWTRKEAWLKGRGRGFATRDQNLPTPHIAVTSGAAGDWWLRNLPVAKGYVGAIAVAGTVKKIERWSWQD